MASPRTKRAVPKEELPDLAADAAEFGGKKVFLAFPSYKTTNPVTAMTLVHLALDMGADAIVPECRFGDAMIYHARNKLAEMFLASDCEWCLWVDDDMVLPTGRPRWFKRSCRLPDSYPDRLAGAHVLKRLLARDEPLVGGCYVARNPSGRIIAAVGSTGGYLSPVNKSSVSSGALVNSDWVGTGCMLVHRRVFEVMREKYPELRPTIRGQSFNYFRPLDDGRGEDQAFCLRAKACGFQPKLDLGVQCMHIGYKAYGYEM